MSKFDISNVAIIGCGTVGANVAINVISKLHNVNRLALFDYDIISGPTSPFQVNETGLHKAIVTRGLCLIENPNLDCTYSLEKVTNDSKLRGYFIIDCRDTKSKDISSDVRISLDDKYLIIDAKQDFVPYTSNMYIFPRNERCIEESIDIILQYFQEERYLNDQRESYVLEEKKRQCYVR